MAFYRNLSFVEIATQKRASAVFLVGLFVTTILISPFSADPVNLPKFVSLVFFSSLCFVMCIADIKLKEFKRAGSFGAATISFVFGAIAVSALSDSDVVTRFYGIQGRNIGLVTLLALAMFMFTGYLLTSENLNTHVISLLISIGLLSVSYGFLQYLNMDPLKWDSNFGRILGFFGNPNFLSAILGLSGIAAVGSLKAGRRSIKRNSLITGFILLVIISILISNSSQGILVLIIGTTFIIYAKFLNTFSRKIHILFIFLILLGPVILYASLIKYFPTGSLAEIGSIKERGTYWEVGFRVWLENPLFGTGLDTFGESFRFYRNLDNIEVVSGTLTNSAHNYFIDILANGGVVLFLPVLYLVIRAVLQVYRALIDIKKVSSQDLTIIGIWIGLFTQAQISPNQIGLLVWFWACTGLVIGLEVRIFQHSSIIVSAKTPTLVEKRKKEKYQLEASQIILSFISVIVSLVIALPPYVASVRYLNALNSGQVEKIYASTLNFPMDVTRNIAVIEAFSNNQFHAQAHSLAIITVEKFPQSFSAWAQLYRIANALPKEKELALLNMKRLDPNNPKLP